MYRYSRRILTADFGSWLPMILTVTCMTILVGICANQFAWTHNPLFIKAVSAGGYTLSEFRIVSESIYMLVAPLVFVSLTVVGSASVERTRTTFAQWRLTGASPRDVRRSTWALVATAALAGAVPGSLLAVPISYLIIPTFNQMAASGFEGPPFQPSLGAWVFALVLGFTTCLVGALVPSIRASKVAPIEVFRPIPTRHRKGLGWRITVASLLLVSCLGMTLAAAFLGAASGGVAALFNIVLNVGIMAVIAVYILGPILAPVFLRLIGRLFVRFRAATPAVACRSSTERAGTSANTLAPLAAGIGGSGVLLSAVSLGVSIIRTTGYDGKVNFTDSIAMLALICVVCLTTSAAVVALSGREIEREHSLLRIAGMSPRTIVKWYGWQSFALSLVATLLSLLPITFAVIAGTLGATSLLGQSLVAFPWQVIVVGLFASTLTLFLVLWLPALDSLKTSIASGLRR